MPVAILLFFRVGGLEGLEARIYGGGGSEVDTLYLAPQNGDKLFFSFDRFREFELLATSEDADGVIGQTDDVTIGRLNLAGGHYTVMNNVNLHVGASSGGITITGEGTTLQVNGKVYGTVVADDKDSAGQFLILSGNNAFNDDAITTIDLGLGKDTLVLDASAWDFSFTNDYIFRNFEVLEVRGSLGVTLTDDFILSGSGSDFATLKLRDSNILRVTGDLTINDAAIIDISALKGVDGGLSLNAEKINLNISEDGGLTFIVAKLDSYRIRIKLIATDTLSVIDESLAGVTHVRIMSADGEVREGVVNIKYSGDNEIEFILNVGYQVLPEVSGDSTLTINSDGFYITSENNRQVANMDMGAGGLGGELPVVIKAPAGGAFTWSGGEVRVEVQSGSDAGVNDKIVIAPVANVDLRMDGDLFTHFEILEKDGDGTLYQAQTLVVLVRAEFKDGTYRVGEYAVLDVPEIEVRTGAYLLGDGLVVMGDVDNVFTVEGGSSVEVAVDGGEGDDFFKINLDKGDLDLTSAEFYGFERLIVVGDGLVRLSEGGYQNFFVEDEESTVDVDGVLTIDKQFFLNGRLTGGVVQIAASGYRNGSLKVYSGSTYSSSSTIAISGELAVDRGGIVEDTTLRMLDSSAGRTHYIKGTLGSTGKPVQWYGSGLGDILYFSGRLQSGSSLDFGAGDDTFYWSGATLAGTVDMGAHTNGDKFVLALAHGDSTNVFMLLSSDFLNKVSNFEILQWLRDGSDSGAGVKHSGVGFTGDWNICAGQASAPNQCYDEVHRHATELHLQTDLTYYLTSNANLNIGYGGALLLSQGSTFAAHFTMPGEFRTSNYQLNMGANATIKVNNVAAIGGQKSAAILSLAGATVNLSSAAGGIGVYLYGADSKKRFVSDARAGQFNFTLELAFDRLLIDSSSANLLFNEDGSAEKTAFKSMISTLFTRIRAYEDGVQYYPGTFVVDYRVADANAATLTLSALILNLTFSASSSQLSGDGQAVVPHPQRGWGLWNSFTAILGADETRLDYAYAQILDPLSHAAFSEDLARYQMLSLSQVLERQQQVTAEQRGGELGLDGYRGGASSVHGWAFSTNKHYVRGDDSDSALRHEFNGVMEAAGMLLPVSDGVWVGAWAGKSSSRREHDTERATAAQVSHEYEGGWVGIYGEYHGKGVRFSGAWSHNQGEVESRRYAELSNLQLSGRGDFALEAWHAQGSISPLIAWRLAGLSIRPELQLRYLSIQQEGFQEQLFLDGAAATYEVFPSSNKLLQGGVNVTLEQVATGATRSLKLGMLEQLEQRGNELSGVATDMDVLRARDRSAWQRLFYLKFKQNINLGGGLSSEFYFESETDLSQYNTATGGIRIQQSF